jgi:uncharacterized protein YqfB (UPF0267 family)
MSYWSQVQLNFRGALEGSTFVLFLIILSAFTLPVLYFLFHERFKVWRCRYQLKARLLKRGLRMDQWFLLEKAIERICPEHPDRLHEHLAQFHVWLDTLSGIQEDNPILRELVTGLEEIVFGSSRTVIIPGSTRDFLPGTALNVVRPGSEQVAVATTVTQTDVHGITLSIRDKSEQKFRAKEILSIFCPRPEAMYHASTLVQSVDDETIRIRHATHEAFVVRQLREFWRVDVDLIVEFHVLNMTIQSADPTQTESTLSEIADEIVSRGDGLLINLSGNGAALVSSTMVPVGASISFDLQIGSRIIRELEAEVLHVTQSRNSYRLHLIFRGLDPTDRETIIRGLFLTYRQRVPEN